VDRRNLLQCLCALAAASGCLPLRAQSAASAPRERRALAVLDFELIDEQDNPLAKPAQELRLGAASRQLRQELKERQLYEVIDIAPSEALQRRLRAQQETVFQCDDCADQIGRLLGVDLVMTTWVQKVSELILNMNVQVYDCRSRAIVLRKSVDMRGNTDASWTRAVSYLVHEMADRRSRDPAYGL
jgi:hypothetical protein